jgi:hypothetical protein
MALQRHHMKRPGAARTEKSFRMLNDDGMTTNPAIHFSAEGFEPSSDFRPSKPFRSHLRDLRGGQTRGCKVGYRD